jgi:hypothetical protein
MANPNLASASSVLVGNALVRLTSTSATQAVSSVALVADDLHVVASCKELSQ